VGRRTAAREVRHRILRCSVLENEYSFAGQFEDKAKTNQTKIIEIVKDNPRRAMTVTFRKKPDNSMAADLLATGQGSMTQRQWRKKVREATAGEERTLVGYHQNKFDEHGRLRFNAEEGPRLIDPREACSRSPTPSAPANWSSSREPPGNR